MVIVIFRSRVKEDKLVEYYAGVEEMAAIATSMPGYISHKSYSAPDGERISVHEWESKEEAPKYNSNKEKIQEQKKRKTKKSKQNKKTTT
jgi:heme-degrading monooxygenase HmoA